MTSQSGMLTGVNPFASGYRAREASQRATAALTLSASYRPVSTPPCTPSRTPRPNIPTATSCNEVKVDIWRRGETDAQVYQA